MKAIICAAAAFMAALAGPACAQDGSEIATQRTPAAAQTFLSLHMGRFIYRDANAAYRPLTISSGDACATTISAEPVYLSPNVTWVRDPNRQPTEFRFDWSKVQLVSKVTGSDSSISVTSSSDTIKVDFSSAAESDRVLAAMDYLRTACDKSAQLGF